MGPAAGGFDMVLHANLIPNPFAKLPLTPGLEQALRESSMLADLGHKSELVMVQ